MKRNRIVLIQPPTGVLGAFIYHMPLGLVYASAGLIKAGFEVAILDLRLGKSDWRERLQEEIHSDTLLIGFSLMSGAPVMHSTRIGLFLKKHYPGIPIVWGGPHMLFNTDDALKNTTIDYGIRGYGSKPLLDLCRYLQKTPGAADLAHINGLTYRTDDGLISVPEDLAVEVLDYRDIPYQLIEPNLHRYGQFGNGEMMFSVYTAMGCPYNCTFCSSPVQTRRHEQRYVKLIPKQVVDHIQHLHRKYGAEYIYIIDDDSFVDPDHVEAIIDEINSRGIKVRLSFRGARINEIKRMGIDFLQKLAKAGTDCLHIGAESGSQRMLDLMNKNIRVEDIIEVNLKLAKVGRIRPVYNWLVGLPHETVEDLIKTQDLMVQIIRENPAAVIMTPNRFRPLNGSELYNEAIKLGYQPPKDAVEWSNVEVESYYELPWVTSQAEAHIRMMVVTSYFIDNKLFKLPTGNGWLYTLLKATACLYKPIAMYRIKRHSPSMLLEYLPILVASAVWKSSGRTVSRL